MCCCGAERGMHVPVICVEVPPKCMEHACRVAVIGLHILHHQLTATGKVVLGGIWIVGRLLSLQVSID
jgi:hypothetical protein